MEERTKSQDTISRPNLLVYFQQVLTKSGFLVTNFKDLKGTLDNFYSFVVEKGGKKIELSFNIRNISNAYLPNKPDIKRRQVGKLSFEDLPLNRKDCLIMLLGLKLISGELVLVCWNPFYFVGHATNRSCYVLKSTMEKALQCGFFEREDCKTKVYACSSSNFGELLNHYIEENVVE